MKPERLRTLVIAALGAGIVSYIAALIIMRGL